MHAWKNMSNGSVTLGLLVACLFYYLFSLPVPADLLADKMLPAGLIDFYQHWGWSTCLLIWYGYANLWAIKPDGAKLGLVLGVVFSGLLGFALSVMLGAFLSESLSHLLGSIPSIVLGGLLGALLGGIPGMVFGNVLGNILNIALGVIILSVRPED